MIFAFRAPSWNGLEVSNSIIYSENWYLSNSHTPSLLRKGFISWHMALKPCGYTVQIQCRSVFPERWSVENHLESTLETQIAWLKAKARQLLDLQEEA